MDYEARTALLIGATGLVGGHCLDLLLKDAAYNKVVALGRRKLPVEHQKLEQHIVDFDRLADYSQMVQGRDVFCCLGTTIKKAGSQEAFRRVDFTYTHEVARIAAGNGAEQVLIVSSLGADPHSRVFYNRVKGEVEEAVSGLPFRGVQIFRPSLLLGERREVRRAEQIAERVMKLFSFAFVGALRKYLPVEARAVASAMIQVAKQSPPGRNVFESDRIAAMNGKVG